jgi:hypothetical protein
MNSEQRAHGHLLWGMDWHPLVQRRQEHTCVFQEPRGNECHPLCLQVVLQKPHKGTCALLWGQMGHVVGGDDGYSPFIGTAPRRW